MTRTPETSQEGNTRADHYRCAHCGRPCGTRASGFARVNGWGVCSHPGELGRPDCYRLVMEEGHVVEDCPLCAGPLVRTGSSEGKSAHGRQGR